MINKSRSYLVKITGYPLVRSVHVAGNNPNDKEHYVCSYITGTPAEPPRFVECLATPKGWRVWETDAPQAYPNATMPVQPNGDGVTARMTDTCKLFIDLDTVNNPALLVQINKLLASDTPTTEIATATGLGASTLSL